MQLLAKQEAANMLATKLAVRPEREDLEKKGKIKDKEVHDAQLEERKQAAASLDAKLQAKPQVQDLADKGLITEADAKRKMGIEEEKKPKVKESLLDVASSLEGKLSRQPERERLETKGMLACKETKKEDLKNAAASLETKLAIRPDKETLEAKGKIKDKDAHEAQKEAMKETAKSLEEKLSGQPTLEEVKDKVLIDENQAAPLVSTRVDWHNRAEVMFTQMDLDSSGDLSKYEVQTIMGAQADALIAKLLPDETGNITTKAWMDHCSKIESDMGSDSLVSFLDFSEAQLAKYVADQASTKLKAVAEDSKAAAQEEEKSAVKSSLETKLSIRPEKAHLEAKGKIKDKETHEAQLAEKKEAKAALEASLGPKLTAEASAAQAEKHEAAGQDLPALPEPDGHDWRNRAEHVFMDMDLDHSMSLEKEEIVAVCGAEAETLLVALQVSESHGNVSLSEWVGHIEGIKKGHGIEQMENFLVFCETKVAESKKAKNYVKKGDLLPEQKETAAALEQKLSLQPDRERLANKGLIKEKHEVEVDKMNKAAAAMNLEKKLSVRPDKEQLEKKGKIKDKETHEAQKKEKIAAKKTLEDSLTIQPSRANMHKTGKLQVKFDPRGNVELCNDIFHQFCPEGKDCLNLSGTEFRAALEEVSKKFEVPLNIDAIISDAKAELELAPDLEGFMEVLDVIESLIDVYLK